MASTVTLALVGVPQLLRAIELTDSGTRENTVQAIRRGTHAIEAKAHSKVPKRSGELDSTIRSEFTNDGMVGLVKAGYGKLLRRSRSTTGDASGRYAKARLKAAQRHQRFRNAKSSKAALAASQLGQYGPVVERGDERRNKPRQAFLDPSLQEETPAIQREIAAAPIKAGRAAGLR